MSIGWFLVGGVLVVVALLFVFFLSGYLKRKAIEKSLMSAAEGMGMFAQTPEEIFEHNFKVLMGMNDPEQALSHLHSWVMGFVLKGEQPRRVDIEHLQKLNRLKPVDQEGLKFYPDAAYEMVGTVKGRVFFRNDLTLAGYKDYSPEIEQIILRVLEQKRLPLDDQDLLRGIHCLYTCSTFGGELYGGPGFPFPDERFQVSGRVGDESVDLTFDSEFNLIHASKSIGKGMDLRSEVIWEKPGARQPELYKK